MSKILLAPDLHNFYDNYGRVLPDGKHSRLVDWERTASYLLQAAVDNDVDIAVFPGDFFKNSRPAPEQIIAVSNLISAFTSNGINVVACPGNHDLVGAGKPGPAELVKLMCDDMMLYFTTVPEVFQVDGVNIAVLPSVKPSALIDMAEDPAALASLVSQKLVEIARGLMVQCHENGPGKKNILIGHWTISGSVASSGQLLYGSTDPVIPLTELTAMEWDAVLFGHIHKAQVLSSNPIVAYAGALERVDFGEEDDERGCFIVDLSHYTSIEWIDLPARQFLTVYANINTSDDIQVLYDRLIGKCGSEYLLLPDIASKIVRVKYKIKEELAVAIDHTKMMQALQASVPEHIAGIFPEVERSDRSRDASITEETGPVEALDKWLVEKGVSKDLIEHAKIVAAKLIMEVLA